MDDQQAKAVFVVRVLMTVIAFTLGLGLAREDFARVATQKKAVLVGMTAQTILVPLLGLGVAWAFRLEPKLAIGLVLLCACPGGVHSNYYNKLARGDVALSMTLTSVSTIVNMATLPLWVLVGTALFAGHGEVVMMSTGATLLELGLALALPLVIGMAMKAKLPTLAAKLEKGMMITTGVLLVALIAMSIAKSAANVGRFVGMVGLPVLVLQTVAMGMSYAFARITGLPEEQRITVALEGGIQNATLAFALGYALTGDVAVTIPAIVYSIAIYFTAAVLIPIGRARVPLVAAAAAAAPATDG